MIDTHHCPVCLEDFMQGYQIHSCEEVREYVSMEIRMEPFSWDYENLLARATRAHPSWFQA